MTRPLQVFVSGPPLPADTVTSTLIVYGGKGMGKTNLLSVLLEEMSKSGLRWCVVDPLGVLYGLRYGLDGNSPGVECLILGGVHGDIDIEPTGGDVVADLVADEDVNVIIDCSRDRNGQMWSVGQKIKFLTAFPARVFQQQGSLVNGRRRPPRFIGLDEAARYIPQNLRSGDKEGALCVSAWEQIVEEGRNVGLGVGLFTQRSARLNKSVAELADAMIAFRTTGPNSISAITDWLGDHVERAAIRQQVEIIRKLPVGEALLVSPGWLERESVVKFRARETFDSSATPKPGERPRRISGRGATVDLDAYRQRMAATIERADANDPKVLRKRIKELESAVAKDIRVEVPKEVVKTVEVPVLSADDLKVVAQFTEQLVSVQRIVEGSVPLLVERLNRLNATPVTSSTSSTSSRRGRVTPVSPVAAPPPGRPAAASVRSASAPAATGDLPKAQRAMLSVLVQHGPCDDRKLGYLAGYAPGSGHFNNTISALRAAGYIAESKSPRQITQLGIDALGEVDPLPTGQELIDYWLGKLAKAPKAMFKALIDAYPDSLSDIELGERSGYAAGSGHFNNTLGRLRSVGLVLGDRTNLHAEPTLGEAKYA